MAGIFDTDRGLTHAVDLWESYKWKEFVDAQPEEVQEAAEAGCVRTHDWPEYMEEVFARLDDDPPPLEDKPGLEWAKVLNEALDSNHDFQRLRKVTQGRALEAALMATALCNTLAPLLPEPAEPAPSAKDSQDILDALDDGRLDSLTPEEQDALRASAQAAKQQGAALAPQDLLALRMAVAEGVKAAQKAAQDAMDALGVLCPLPGVGSGDGEGKGGDIKQKVAALKAAKRSSKFKAVADIAGRMRNIAHDVQRRKVQAKAGDLYGREWTDDLGACDPEEMSLLALGAGGRAVVLTRMADRELLGYRYKGNVPKGKGPVIVLLDGSGSMAASIPGVGGSAEVWGKAVALALRDIAADQGRDFALVHFTSRVNRAGLYPKGKATPQEILEELEYFPAGGTAFEPALETALDILEKSAYNNADVVMVTDGFAPVNGAFLEKWNEAKARRQHECYSIVIGVRGQDPYGSLAAISGESKVFCHSDLMDDGEVLETVFSI